MGGTKKMIFEKLKNIQLDYLMLNPDPRYRNSLCLSQNTNGVSPFRRIKGELIPETTIKSLRIHLNRNLFEATSRKCAALPSGSLRPPLRQRAQRKIDSSKGTISKSPTRQGNLSREEPSRHRSTLAGATLLKPGEPLCCTW